MTVSYRTADGTAAAGLDYDAVSGTLTSRTTQQVIAVQTREDGIHELDEAFTMILSNPNGAALADATALGTITDDDVPALAVADATAVEGETARFAVTLSPPSDQTVTVSYRTADGTAAAGLDYDTVSGTLTFAPRTTRQVIAVQTREDGIGELDEAFTVILSNPNGAALANATALGTITDDDVPALAVADATAVEGEAARFAVTLSPPSDQTVTVSYRTAGGTAAAGLDYDTVSGTLTFAPRTARQVIAVQTREDGIGELDEAFTVILSNPNGAALADATALGTITDDDVPALAVADATAVEGEAARFAVTLSPPSDQTVTVSYRTAGGTAAAGLDYDTVSGTLTFAPRTARQVIAVQTREDGIGELDEAFTVILSNPNGAALADATALGTITDDDVPALAVADATAVEGEAARFAVTLSPPSDQTVTVSYRTADGTAAAGLDYDTVSGTLTFAPRTARQVIAVQTREDGIGELDEAFTVILSNPNGAALANATALGTITDDDVPTLAVADATAVEGEAARFAVTLSPPSDQTVTVSYRTADGTAAAGLDYDTVSGTLTFAPRTARQVIAVQTREDGIHELDEAFTVILSNPNGAALADATALGTITDDDVRTLKPINQELLSELGRALAFTAVRCRIEQAFSDMARGWTKPSFQPSLSLVRPSLEWEEIDARTPTLEQLLGSTSFRVPLMGEDGGAASFAAWGCGDYRKLAGRGKSGTGPWDGETFTIQVGADAIVDANLLAGVALSQSRGTLDFDEARGSGEAGVHYDLRLTGVHPYVGLWVSPDLEIWGTLSLGKGTFRIADALAGSSPTSAATLVSGTVGANGQLLTRGATTLKLKSEGAIAHMAVARSSTTFRETAIDLQRLRLAIEADYEQVIPYVGVLAPWGELGLRHDGGDGVSGASLEAGGGLHLRNIEQGWNAEVYGRWLAVREDDRPEEQGIGARFRYDPDAPGFGPWVSLTQGWGETASGLPSLWQDDAINLKSHNLPARRLDAELAYGFSAFGGQGTITPYGAMSLKSTDGPSYRLGGRLMLGSSATVSLEAERRERPAEASAYTVTIGAAVRF